MMRVMELSKVWSEVIIRNEDACRVNMYYTLVVVTHATPLVAVDKEIHEE